MQRNRLITWRPAHDGLAGQFAGGVLLLKRTYIYPQRYGRPEPIGWTVMILETGGEADFLKPGGGRWRKRGLTLARPPYFKSVAGAIRAAQAAVTLLLRQ